MEVNEKQYPAQHKKSEPEQAQQSKKPKAIFHFGCEDTKPASLCR